MELFGIERSRRGKYDKLFFDKEIALEVYASGAFSPRS